ncbi:hypothetical protein KEM52_000703, partial [Ascosphaera acerosa]
TPNAAVPWRSLSAISRPVAPRPETPIHRSQTDAPDRRRSRLDLDLPAIPTGRMGTFTAAKLTSVHYSKCDEPWAVSAVVDWLRARCDGCADLDAKSLLAALTGLFTYHVPMLSTSESEALAAQLLSDMLRECVLIEEESWYNFSSVDSLSGVLWQLTGSGCYAQNVHRPDDADDDQLRTMRCYSQTCMRKRMDIKELLEGEEHQLWHERWNLDLTKLNISKTEMEYQNAMHEFVNVNVNKHRVLLFIAETVPKELRLKSAAGVSIMTPNRMRDFIKEVFGHYKVLVQALKDYLIVPLLLREETQGPIVKGLSDIIRDFLKNVRPALLAFAQHNNMAEFSFKRVRRKNVYFAAFIEEMSAKAPGKKTPWDSMTIAAHQLLPASSATIEKMERTCGDPREKAALQAISQEWRDLTLAYNAELAKAENINAPRILAKKIGVRVGVPFKLKELQLEQKGRMRLCEGELSNGKKRVRVILLDNYLIIAKDNTTSQKDPSRPDYELTVPPIPMRLLVLENHLNDVPKGRMTHINRTPGIQFMPEPIAASSSQLNGGGNDVDGTLYPFDVRCLGSRTPYTLYPATREQRDYWCEQIMKAIQNHTRQARATDPFDLRVLAHDSFTEPGFYPVYKRYQPAGTAVQEALEEMQRDAPTSPSTSSPNFRVRIHCATVFKDVDGVMKCLLGTSCGLYVSAYENPSGWQKIDALAGEKIDMISVIEAFRLVVVLCDGTLYACRMEAAGDQPSSLLQAPQQVSKNSSILFFTVGIFEDTLIVLYAYKHGTNTNYKLLEPVLQQTAPSKRQKSKLFAGFGNFGSRSVEHFRVKDELYIPDNDIRNMAIYPGTIGVTGSRKFYKRFGWKYYEVPFDPQSANQQDPSIRATWEYYKRESADSKALGFFKLNEKDFLLVYDTCGVVMNDHGGISRSTLHHFASTPEAACLSGGYLILFYEDFIEIMNAFDGRQRQIIVGSHIRPLDDRGMADMPGSSRNGHGHSRSHSHGHSHSGSAAPRTVKFSMQNPNRTGSQLIVELVERRE